MLTLNNNIKKSYLYWEVIKFNFSKMLAYPWEMAAFFTGRIIGLGFLAIFWFAVAKSNPGMFDFRQLLAYFLIVSAVKELTISTELWLGRDIQTSIKRGEINNILIKPVKEIKFLTASFIGWNGLAFLYAIIAFFLGIKIFPPKSIINFAGFILFALVAFLISVSINVYVGILSFYSPEARGILSMVGHIIKILSGSLIPLIYFPDFFKKIVILMPFPSLAFTPVYVLQNQVSKGEFIYLLLIAIFWAIFLYVSSNYLWKKSLKNYEGVGI